MTQSARLERRFTGRWLASFVVPAAVQLALSLWAAPNLSVESPTALFWIVVIAASLCVVTSLALIVRARKRHEADLGFLGLFFFSVSILALVHGITTPGVLVGGNTSTMTSVLVSIPVGLLAIAPTAIPRRHRHARWLRNHWLAWVSICLAAVSALAAALLIDLDLLPAPTPRQPFTIAVALVSLLGCVLLSRRHLTMSRIAAQPGPLVVSLGCGFVGSSALVWLSTQPFSAGFWSAHVLDIAGVFSATVGGLIAYHRTGRVNHVLAPVLVTDPLAALEIGLDQVVHRFVADLDDKDRITRDHVVRTAELAVLVGQELGLDPASLRRVGLTAILHDVGKLEVPDEILNKPGRLTDNEFAVIKRHVVLGEQLVRASPVLEEIAAGVRGHHERIDGAGYPDGLVAGAIPHDARIVAVCDSFDAMANTRQYRAGMAQEKAIAILNEHAGSQWDETAVEALLTVLKNNPNIGRSSSALDGVGRVPDGDLTHARVGCDCLPEPLITTASQYKTAD